tara:strand:- start:1587 stop:2468 length:882 start_codon:yes stop_codon:yes gene_type:complete
MSLEQAPYGNNKSVKVPKISEADYQLGPLKQVLNIKSIVESNCRYIDDVILHGSVATLDYIANWSDLDLMVVLKEEALETEQAYATARHEIRSINSCTTRFDKTQHHGAHVLIDKDFEMYPNVFLPCELWKDAKSLLADKEYHFWNVPSCEQERNRLLNIHETFSKASKSKFLHHHPFWSEYLEDDFKNAHNGMYQMKYFLSVIMLLPSLFMNLQEVYCRKKDSFELCREYISSKNYEIIDRASQIRSTFAYSTRLQNNRIPPWLCGDLGPKYFERAAALTEEMVNKCNITTM